MTTPMTDPKTMTSDRIASAALALREARATRRPITQVSTTFDITGLADAYAVAGINARERVRAGGRVTGRKIGLTSVAVQKQLGVDQPDFGMLFDDMEYLDGSDVPSGRLIQPRVEAEVAFVLGRDLSVTAPTYGEFAACVAFCLPALEIVDSAIADWKITLVDTVADNASCGLYVLGDQPVPLGQSQLAELTMGMKKNGVTVSTGSGAACMGHPLRAAYWLAQTMAARGQPLKAGEVILSGALGPMVPLCAGDEIRANLGPMGSVACRMV
jgi:2-keto-4-pentenoate hydratase